MSLRPPLLPVRPVAVRRLPEPGTCQGGCLYEPKFDGWRAIAFIGRGQVLLQSRTGKPLHRYFPDVIRQLAVLPPDTVIDGELVVWNAAAGRTSFAALQQRIVAGRGLADLVAARPAHLVCFDLLEDGGTELLGLPLVQRRDRLTSILTAAPTALQLCPQTADLDEARQWISELPATGVEGVVIKGAETPYRPGQPDWAKYRIYMTALAVIGGVAGTRAEPTALLLGQFDQAGRLRYVARSHRLGPAAQRVLAAAQLRPATRHPWPQPLPTGWVGSFNQGQVVAYTAVEPEIVAEIEVDAAVEYHRWRHGARFVGIRRELQPMQLPRISADDWSRPPGPPALAE